MPVHLLIIPALVQAFSPLSPAPSQAQAVQTPQAAQIMVTVRDIPGDPLAGVKVSLEGNQRGLDSETNELGQASFGALPPGRYRLKAEKAGYRPLSQEFQVDPGPTRKIELRMIKDSGASAPKKPAASA